MAREAQLNLVHLGSGLGLVLPHHYVHDITPKLIFFVELRGMEVILTRDS